MLDWARSRGLPYVVFTNGTNRTPAHFARVLRDAGVDAPDDRTMSRRRARWCMFARRGFKRVLVLGVSGLIEPLLEAGIEVVRPTGTAFGAGPGPGSAPPVDAVRRLVP